MTMILKYCFIARLEAGFAPSSALWSISDRLGCVAGYSRPAPCAKRREQSKQLSEQSLLLELTDLFSGIQVCWRK